MTDWSEGYVKGIDYTLACYPELNPARARLPFLQSGHRFPERIETGCELGFGFGLSTLVHAAASGTEWCGNDFNPAQAAFAQELARSTGARAHLVDDAFLDFCGRTDLPDFDFIGLHGIWSWVSPANRTVILDFLRRKLKPGGIVYMSFNALPGWSQVMPLQKLLLEHSKRMSPPGAATETRIEAALGFVKELVAEAPAMAALYPMLTGRLAALPTLGKSYLAHEYFNCDWEPMAFSEVAERMETAKATFACSADFAHHFTSHNLIGRQAELLAAIPDPVMRETTRDFMINREFRKDYWVKGSRHLSEVEQAKGLLEHRVMLVADPATVTTEAGGALVNGRLDASLVSRLVEALADARPRSLLEIASDLAPHGLGFDQVVEAVMILIGKGQVASAVEEADLAGARKSALRFNQAALARSIGGQALPVLASPVTGGGVGVAPFYQLFLLARTQGQKTPAQWAKFVWQHLQGQGRRVVTEGRTLESEEENLAALLEEAQGFAVERLPRLVGLGIA